MFSTSSQLRFWMFSNSSELDKLRQEANEKYIHDHQIDNSDNSYNIFLTSDEEAKVRSFYEGSLKEFCTRFDPPMPSYVIGTAIAFFKRLYLHTSVMDCSPKEYIYTCAYLACKVEEFNLSISQFVLNMDDFGHEEAIDLILSQELLLMERLHYHLTVHNPYRPIEGLLIDIKTRCPEISDPERLRKGAEEFLDKSLLTDACMLFSPSQIALAALVTSGTNLGLNFALDSYIANKLIDAGGHETHQKMVNHIRKLRHMVRKIEENEIDLKEITELESKLERCRNRFKADNTEMQDEQMSDSLDDEDHSKKRLRLEVNLIEEDPMDDSDLSD